MHWTRSWGIVLVAVALAACGDDAVGGAVGTQGGTASDGSTGTNDASDTDSGLDSTGDGDASGSGSDGVGVVCERNADCDDNNPCTDDDCNSGMCEVDGAVVSVACRPVIDVDFPPRAATVQSGSPTVTVTGTVQSGAGPIAWLRINDEEVGVADDGTFSHDVTARTGGNTLVLETADIYDATRTRVQSFLWSTDYRLPTVPVEGIAPEGLGIYLDQETIDDGDRTLPLDDIASLMNLAVDSIDIAQFIDPTTPIANSAGYNVFLTGISYSSTDVALSGIDGGLHLQASLFGISGPLVFDCTILACIAAGGDGTGSMTINSIQVDSDLMLSVGPNNDLVVEAVGTQTTVNDLDITSNNVWTNFLIAIIEPFIIGGIVADIESELTGQVDALLGPALSQALGGLAPNSILAFPNLANAAEPIEVQLATDFQDTDFHDGAAPPAPSPPQGGLIMLRGGGYAQAPVAPYRNLGIPDRAGCGQGGGVQMPRDALLEIGLTDDLLNQLLHGAWDGGLLEFEMPPELLGGGEGFIEDLEVHVSGMLAPTASDCSRDGMVRVHLGDVRIDASLSLAGAPITFVAFSSMVAGLEFTPSQSGVEITVSEVEMIDTELSVNEDAAIETEPLLASTLETQLVDGVLGAIANGGLGTIDLPPIDLSATLGLPPGTAALEIVTDDVVRAPGVTVIRGHL